MANDSSSGGALLGAISQPNQNDLQLQNFLHDWLVGITGLAPINVVPKWQPEAPNIGAITTDWLAFGITDKKTEGYPYIHHVNSSVTFPNGYDELIRHEVFRLSCSIYGPNADNTSTILREGIYVPQNNEALWLNGMGLVHNTDIITMPELFKDRWVYKNILSITIRRNITIQYAIENILTASGTIYTDYIQKNGTYYHESFTN